MYFKVFNERQKKLELFGKIDEFIFYKHPQNS